ncbi:hypothetical protein SH580_20170 [Coraliomargarita algicola]|uniref:DNA recombination protein RmuC n=1 Tax=Coraliomargarita algicola TaxID=3092156 RepID=A0ABZ0RKE5_9BACT|nr:hypothetical protein [Coraliomargarita sp. J2-16]WPJ95739.1 hypothetical protein SH580_20170 [Coraliomargarita sp. J2-16]
MKEMLINIFTHPLVIGLCIGLIAALIIWLRSLGKLRAERSTTAAQAAQLNREIATLKGHLHTQMEITAKGNESLKEELVALQQTNQNLSQTIGALKQKPGRVEIRTLHLYEKAIRVMNARAPGFSSAWESAINEAEAEIKQEESGIVGWIRKPFMFRRAGSTELLGNTEKVAD